MPEYLGTEVHLQARKISFSLLQSFQLGSGIHLDLYPVRALRSFPSDEAQRPASETDTSPQSSAEVKN